MRVPARRARFRLLLLSNNNSRRAMKAKQPDARKSPAVCGARWEKPRPSGARSRSPITPYLHPGRCHSNRAQGRQRQGAPAKDLEFLSRFYKTRACASRRAPGRRRFRPRPEGTLVLLGCPRPIPVGPEPRARRCVGLGPGAVTISDTPATRGKAPASVACPAPSLASPILA